MNQLSFLKERRPSDHFELHYGLRDPSSGQGVGLHGVRDEEFLQLCFGTFERSFSFLLAKPLDLPAPRKRVPVYIFEIGSIFPSGGGPFTFQDERGDPYIAMPSRTDAPTKQEEFRHAVAAACHETFHATVWSLHSLRSLISKPWRWFHEGCAVWSETQVLPDVVEYLRFGMNWCDRPDISLDDDRGLYESGFFVRYLAKRFGPELIGQIWRSTGGSQETPWQAIQRLRPAAWARLLPDYCRDAFFLADPASDAYSPDLVQRYHGRAVHDVVHIQPDSPKVLKGQLNHLACRYYLVISHTLPALRLTKGDPPIRAELAGITVDRRKTLDAGEADRWVVIVSNNGLTEADDHLPFELEIAAE